MKKNDIVAIVVIVAVSVLIAYFVGRAVLGNLKPRDASVEVVDVITADIQKPDPSVFSKDGLNPSVSINIGTSTNQQPFGE